MPHLVNTDTDNAPLDGSPPPSRRVRYDPTVNLGHILTFAAMLAAGTAAWNAMDKRLTVLEEARVVQKERDLSQDASSRERMFDIQQILNKIDGRLDKISDRMPPMQSSLSANQRSARP
jgi:hypothetical protein